MSSDPVTDDTGRGMAANARYLRRFVSAYVKPRAGKFAVVQLLHVVSVAALLLPPLVVRYIINSVIPQRDMTLLWIASAGLLALYVVFAVAAGIKEYWGHEVAQRITSRLRDDLYSHFQKLSLSFHDRKKTGSLLARIVDDMNIIQEAVHHGPEAIVMSGTMLAGAVGLLLWMDWRLALVPLAITPIMVLFTACTAGKMWRRFREVRQTTSSLSDVLEENLSGIQVIKSFGAEGREAQAVARANADHYRSRMSVIRYIARLFPGALLLNGASLAGVTMLGAMMIMRGQMRVGDLTAFIMYLGFFLHPILRVVMMMEQGGRFFASMERFWDYIDIEPDIRDVPGAENLETCRGEVRFDNVHFRYDTRDILQGVSFTAEPGQMVALVGPSGAGKTTIVRLIPRFYEPFDGRVLVDGHDVRDVTMDSLRSHIGTVMQDDFLFSGTVADNIGYGRPDATREDIVHAARMANAADFIEQLDEGFDTTIGKRGVKLSEGQRQRLSIARALLRNPQILLLDEATSSVDPETELLIQQAIDTLREGRTTFAIAHRLSTIFEADKILFVQDGRIVEWGTHDELLRAGGPYARFFEIQFRDMRRV